jgi:hypothetical protein
MMDHFLHVLGFDEPFKIDDTLENTVRMALFDSPNNRVNAIVWQDATRKFTIPFSAIVALESRVKVQ